MRRTSSFLPILLLLCVAGAGDAQELSAGRWIDLTHPFSSETIYWPTEGGFVHTPGSVGVTEGGWWYASYSFASAEHGGTHVDAPIHFAEHRRGVAEIPVEQLIGPAAVVRVAGKCAGSRDYQVAVADFEAWEREHGRLPAGAIVLLDTGSSRFWPDRVRYMGTDLRGAEGAAALHFPGLHPEAARWLVEERTVGAVGLDTPSIDFGPSKTFETHRILSDANVPALENVAHLDRLPDAGAFVVALPMKIEGGSGGPVRIVALLPE